MENGIVGRDDAWLVYDGECPVCATYSKYIRIRQTVGHLHLVDARHPSALLDEITRMGLDIDQGMVLKFRGVIYYAADAVYMLTMLGSPSGLFNRMNYYVFGSRIGARIFYPAGKAFRNLVLKLLGIAYIDNLKRSTASQKIRNSQRYFNMVSLFFYDAILYGVISKYAWGCSADDLDAHYRRYLRSNHLEVGVGTGFLLNRVVFDSARPRLALMDLSRACLERTRRKVARYEPTTHVQNLLEPVAPLLASFDSIAINYVMHCIPGSFRDKGIAFLHLRPLLSEHGVLFGTTVLSEGVRKNWLAAPFMSLMNRLGVFNNRGDNAHELRAVLEEHFRVIEFKVVGVTAYFAVSKRPA